MIAGRCPACDSCDLLGWFALMYNSLVQSRNRCDESWADIDTELKRRYDLIPNLVNTVQGYAKHEREVLEQGDAGPHDGDGQ